jgi:hypothetical protein
MSIKDFFWQTIVGTKITPAKDTEKRKTFKKAFQQLWVAGTLGAFFAALARNIPTDVRGVTCSLPLTDSIFDRSIRYGYVLWLLVYFFVSNLQNDKTKLLEVKKWDVIYDVVQSVLSLIALFFLGFILPDTSYKRGAYAVTNVAILTICALSLAWFGHDSVTEEPGINRLRWAGVAISALSVLLAVLATFGRTALWGFLILQLVLWALLLVFVRLRMDT